MITVVTSRDKEVVIGDGHPTVIIGELSTGDDEQDEKRFDVTLLQKDAAIQVEHGADIIDLRLNVHGKQEVELLPVAVQALMEAVNVPLCLHTSNLAALEEALKIYKGKPLINGMFAEAKSLEAILPLARKYGAAVIGRVHDMGEKFPDNVERRLALARMILKRADETGVQREDIILDCLTFSPSVEAQAGYVTIETVRRVTAELGLNTLISDKHLSFGMPDTALLDQAFAALAIGAGVSCLMVDAAKVKKAVLAADVMLGRDRYARRYLKEYRSSR